VSPWTRLVVVATLITAVSGAVSVSATTPSGASTDASNLVGAGGAFISPIISALQQGDTSGIAPLDPFYSLETLDEGISDFVGSGPGQFNADFAVSERPLTSAEASTAATDGRSFTYVPFAATPVAIATLVPLAADYGGAKGAGTITSGDFCQHIPLTTTLLGDVFGRDTTDPLGWGDTSRVTCTGGGALYDTPIVPWANLDPTMENETVMSLLDSIPTSEALFDAGLNFESGVHETITTSDTPSEAWPYANDTIPGGDEPLIGKLLDVDPRSNAPSNDAGEWQLGAVVPISSVWTGSPLGVAWNIPTAAIQNAQSSFVPPSSAAAEAAEASITMSSSNVVTFQPSTNAAAYNNYLMVEDYLVVPTSDLSSAKDAGLAQFIRYVLGQDGQTAISNLGAAPATTAMVTAGLRVADQLDVQAAAASTSASTTTTAPGAATAATAAGGAGASSDTDGSGGATGSGSDGSGTDGSSAGLAFTGSDPIPPVVVGLVLVFGATLTRRKLRRRRAHR
jgi:hypothetical protein